MHDWERRLREMVLAGGALAAAACADNVGTAADAAHSFGGDACCNASPDPCCQVLSCGEPMTAACACQMEGGTPSYSIADGSFPITSLNPTTSPNLSCSFPGDAGPADAGPDGDGSQVPQDAGPSYSSDGCCNANPDPCCLVLGCGEPMFAACACQMEGGTPNYSIGDSGGYYAITSPNVSCLFPGDAALNDAGTGGDGHD